MIDSAPSDDDMLDTMMRKQMRNLGVTLVMLIKMNDLFSHHSKTFELQRLNTMTFQPNSNLPHLPAMAWQIDFKERTEHIWEN